MLRFWSEFEVFWGVCWDFGGECEVFWGVCWDFGVTLRFFGVFVGILD